METKEIVEEIKKRYLESQEKNSKSYDCGITKNKRIVYIKISNVEYRVNRENLKDDPIIGDELEGKIWDWIQK